MSCNVDVNPRRGFLLYRKLTKIDMGGMLESIMFHWACLDHLEMGTDTQK